jgi:hypothetical protein
MNKNMGQADRIVRAVVGLAIVAWGVASSNWLGAIGLIPLATAAIGWCPVYVPFGIKTFKSDAQA